MPRTIVRMLKYAAIGAALVAAGQSPALAQSSSSHDRLDTWKSPNGLEVRAPIRLTCKLADAPSPENFARCTGTATLSIPASVPSGSLTVVIVAGDNVVGGPILNRAAPPASTSVDVHGAVRCPVAATAVALVYASEPKGKQLPLAAAASTVQAACVK